MTQQSLYDTEISRVKSKCEVAMTLLYLLRHGEIEWPEPDCFMGQTDALLSPRGRIQAEAWSRSLHDVEFAALGSSDLKRAVETARLIFSGRAAQLRISKDLREIQLGQWDGLPRRRVSAEHPDLWLARGQDMALFRPPGGESFQDLQDRVVPRMARMASHASGRNVGIVAHAGVIRVFICHCLEMPLGNLFRIRLDYGSLSIVDYTPGRIEVRALNLKPTGFSRSVNEQG